MWTEVFAAAVGGAIGAVATVGGGLYLAKRAREDEERTAKRVLSDALNRFNLIIRSFVARTEDQIDIDTVAKTRKDLLEAHEELRRLRELIEHLLNRDRGFSAKTLLGIFGILDTLRQEQDLWAKEREIISGYNVTKLVLKIHIEKLRDSAATMASHAEDALAEITARN